MVPVFDNDAAPKFAAKRDMEDMPPSVPKQVTKHYQSGYQIRPECSGFGAHLLHYACLLLRNYMSGLVALEGLLID